MDFIEEQEEIYREPDRVFRECLIEQENISLNALGIEELLEGGQISEDEYLDLFMASIEAEKHTQNQIRYQSMEKIVNQLQYQLKEQERKKEEKYKITLDQRIDYIKNRFKDVLAYLHRTKKEVPHYEKIIAHINRIVLPNKRKIIMNEEEFSEFDLQIYDLFYKTALVRKIKPELAKELIDELMGPIDID